MSLRDDLKAARALIATPETWCQNTAVTTTDEGVTQYCALGAAWQVATDGVPGSLQARYEVAARALNASARALHHSDIVWANDHRDHQAVLDCYDRAIALADDGDEP